MPPAPNPQPAPHWSFWIDVGGTFTDCIAQAPDGTRHQRKVLSTDDAPVRAIRQIMQLADDQPVGPVSVGLGTTRGTNALLERTGAAVGLVTTAGFADLLAIGTQARPHLFRLHIERPPPLYERVVEVDERISAAGEVLTPLDEHAATHQLEQLRRDGLDAIAVCLVNAYVNDAHEQRVAAIARRLGFAHVAVSSQLSPTIRALDRGDTAVLDAYLSPTVRTYVQRLLAAMPESRLRLMTSAGAMAAARRFSGRDSLLSGPAGGVVGCAAAATAAGFEQALGFDMGGTSTDVSRWDGRYEYTYSTEQAGVRVVAPMLAIETVAAGGGSVCDYDGQRLTVGPRSAGADPGPACYGRGGPLALTDINLFNGRIDPRRFPFPLDTAAVERRLAALGDRVTPPMTAHELADGFTRVANLRMANAIRAISAARGYDPADHVLVAFGGAAGQHCCAVAGLLGIRRILLHPLAGVLSAHGIAAADVTRFAERSVLAPLDEATLASADGTFNELAETLRDEVRAEGIAANRIEPPQLLLDLRYVGEDAAITVPRPGDGDWQGAFAAMHQQLYGHAHPDRAIEIVTLRAAVTGRVPPPPIPTAEVIDRRPAPAIETTAWFGGQPRPAACYDRDDLRPGDRFDGPAIVYERLATIVVDPGWSAQVTERFDLLLTDSADATPRHAAAQPAAAAGGHRDASDPVRLELFNNHFAQIATEMGVTLQRTALSVNVKERLDFSCAILDASGALVVNAPHIPVHLGALPATVRALLAHTDDLRPGDAYVTNDPDLGGSHLPDLSVITPIFDDAGRQLRFFAASRAHHAEIGGLRPGSASPTATCLAEEGVVLRHLRIVRAGVLDEPTLRAALTSGRYPSRDPDTNVADIRAQLAANTRGARELQALIARHGWPTTAAYMAHIRAAAATRARAAIAALPDGQRTVEDRLDDDALLRLTVAVTGEQLRLDFTGTGGVNPSPLNATRAVVEAAVIYCLRCLIDADIPLNDGLLEPVTLVLPAGMLSPPACDDPARHAAVMAGNVELSQRVVDLLLAALDRCAASQGTMNNFVFGDASFGYYETICGGAGAGHGFHGAAAVHTHMTNTRLTDVEVLEQRHPVRVRRFAIRRGSGGDGRWRGGDGVVREIEFRAPLSVSLITQRRVHAPFGLAGGAPGATGRNALRRAGQPHFEDIGGMAAFDARPGDVLRIETPGGGGCGGPAAG